MCKSHPISTTSRNLILHKPISLSKFPVILAKCPVNATKYVVKAFTHDSSSRSSYLREKQILSSLRHPNIINSIPKSSFSVDIPNSSYILMEYAPYGDFFNLIIKRSFNNEKLVRTYFHQLIQGLEYLHKHGVAHLDIKLENLLLGKDLMLKIADFDVAQNIRDNELLSQGSVNYRAPEIRSGECKNYRAADVYSAGICLFTLLSRAFPFIEDEEDDTSMKTERYGEFLQENDEFWVVIERMLGNKIPFSESLKTLLNGMWSNDSSKRFSLDDVKNSKWYNESIYSNEEMKTVVLNVLAK